MDQEFIWDEAKATGNVRKHGISFDEAASAFGDPFSKRLPSLVQPVGETRYLLIGHSSDDRLIVVAHVERGEDIVRIISARLATRRERRLYEEGE